MSSRADAVLPSLNTYGHALLKQTTSSTQQFPHSFQQFQLPVAVPGALSVPPIFSSLTSSLLLYNEKCVSQKAEEKPHLQRHQRTNPSPQ